MKKKNVKVPIAIVVEVRDYHEFDDYQEAIYTITGLDYGFTELENDGYYSAVFYLKGHRNDPEVKKMIKENTEKDNE